MTDNSNEIPSENCSPLHILFNIIILHPVMIISKLMPNSD